MSTDLSPVNTGYFLGEDETVDELMDDLAASGEPARFFSGDETIAEEIGPRERFEELIAPETLFPDEIDESE